MFDLIILTIINIVSEVLFNNLIKSFYLFVDLIVKGCKKLAIYFKLYYKRYKES